MKPNQYTTHTLNGAVSNVLFRTKDWVVVEFPDQGKTNSIWMAHCCDEKKRIKRGMFTYQWIHIHGMKSTICVGCDETIPTDIKTIYTLMSDV